MIVNGIFSNNDKKRVSIKNTTCSGANHAESGDPEVNSQPSTLPFVVFKPSMNDVPQFEVLTYQLHCIDIYDCQFCRSYVAETIERMSVYSYVSSIPRMEGAMQSLNWIYQG